MSLRGAIYSRFSTDKQSESSIEDQVRVCTEWCTKTGGYGCCSIRGSGHQRCRHWQSPGTAAGARRTR